MAYFYTSNHPEIPTSYQYYDQYYNNYNHSFTNQDSRYVQYSDYSSQFYGNAAYYQQALTPPLVGYCYSNYVQPDSVSSKNANFHQSGEFYDHVSTEYVTYYNDTTPAKAEVEVAATDADSADSSPKPNSNPTTFHGGYDINEKYGKPLPPSEDICYPKTKTDPTSNNVPSLGDFSYGSVPSPYVNDAKNDVGSEAGAKQVNGVSDGKVIQEEYPSDFEEYDEEDEFEEDDEEDGFEEEEEDGFVDGAMINEAEPKQTNENITSKVIQEEKASDLEGGGKKEDDLGKEPSKSDPIVPLNDAIHAKEDHINEGEAKPKNGIVVDEKASVFEEKEEEEEEEEVSEGGLSDHGRIEEEYGSQVRRQIPPGYGMEAIDLCEGVFGGYFPCLWKRNQRVYNHQRDANDKMSDYDYCWKETAEYLFGNPNPYGGTMPEKGSYGDPVYSYLRHYPHHPLTQQLQYHTVNNEVNDYVLRREMLD